MKSPSQLSPDAKIPPIPLYPYFFINPSNLVPLDLSNIRTHTILSGLIFRVRNPPFWRVNNNCCKKSKSRSSAPQPPPLFHETPFPLRERRKRSNCQLMLWVGASQPALTLMAEATRPEGRKCHIKQSKQRVAFEETSLALPPKKKHYSSSASMGCDEERSLLFVPLSIAR